MQIVTVNLLAVFAATVSSFVMSGFLHGVVFKGVNVGAGKTQKMTKDAIPVALLSTFVMYYALARVLALAETATWVEGVQGAVWVWLGFILPLQIAVKYTNDLSWKTLAVNTTCMLASLAIGGAIIGGW